MAGLLLLAALLLFTAPISNGCENNWPEKLKQHEKMLPCLGPFFSKLYERAKMFLDNFLNSNVTVVRKLQSSTSNKQVKVLEPVKNYTEQWFQLKTLVVKLKSQNRPHSVEMMHLIYKIKNQFDQLQRQGKLVDQSYKELENMLPNDLRAIVFEEEMFITTQEYSHLVSATPLAWGQGYMVQMCRARTCRSQASEWYFEPHEEQGKLFFYITSNYMKKRRVLALGDSNGDNSRSLVVLEKNAHDRNQKWFVEPVEGGRFVIRNWSGPYLYAYGDRCWATISECSWEDFRSHNAPNVLTDSIPMQKLRMKNPRCENEKLRELVLETFPI